MKFIFILLILKFTLITSKNVYQRILLQDDFDSYHPWEDEIIIRRNWITDNLGPITEFFAKCPSCINSMPVLSSPPNCKCYFKTKITENDKMCCIR